MSTTHQQVDEHIPLIANNGANQATHHRPTPQFTIHRTSMCRPGRHELVLEQQVRMSCCRAMPGRNHEQENIGPLFTPDPDVQGVREGLV